MKITHNKIGQKLNITDGAKTDKANDSKGLANSKSIGAGATSLMDSIDAAKVDVSSRAQDAKKIKELAMQAPDVDMEKVEKFRRLIDSGQYKVDAKAVADKMVDDHLDIKN